ncbi:MAG: intermembrane phospholipid transport protein YdbH family protein [Nitrospira sp.]
MRVTIRIEKTIDPLLTLIGPGNRPRLAQIRIQHAVVERADLKLVVENIEADATLGEEKIVIDAVSMQLRPLDLPYWNQPVDLAGRGAVDAGTVAFGGTITSAAGRVVATFEGIAQTREATGQAQFELRRIAFAPGGLQPNELVPALGDFLTAVSGNIAASGTLRWSEGEPAISGRLSLRDLSFVAGGVGVENLTSAITFERVWPPQTPPGQVLTVGRIDPGLEVSDGTARFQLDDRGRLRIEHAAFAFSGGTLSVDPLTLDPQADHHNMVFRAESLNLQEVLDAASVEAAHASGSVSGQIPVSLSPSGVAVNHATLAADAPGFLRYQPTVPPGALQQEDDGVALLRDALTNFHYDRFAVTLDGGSSQEWQSTIHIAGSNPDVLEGHPFVLNVNLRVVPGEALVDLGAQRVNVGDTLPLYNALFGLNFLEWLGDRLAAIDALLPSPAD